LLAAVLAAAARLDPRAEVRVSLWSGRSANTRFARSEVTSCGDVQEDRLSVTVALGKRHASATLNQIDAGSVRETVERAYRMARVSPEDPESLPLLGRRRYLAVPSSHDPAVERLSAKERATAVKNAIDAAGERLEVAGFVEHVSGTTLVATSQGARGTHRATSMRMSTTARTREGQGSGWAAGASVRAAEVVPKTIVARAVDKAMRAKSPGALEPGRYTVVLEPAAVVELLNFLNSALGAREADEGRSFFAAPAGNKIGQKLFSEHVTLKSDPADSMFPSAPFDPEGLPLEPTTWIDRGRLTALRYTRYWAQKKGKEPTGAHGTLTLVPGGHTAEELIAGVKKGLLVTRFWYSRWLDPQSLLVTGLTRDGLFLIENGEVTAPVNNFRYNESVAHLLQNIDAVGRERVRLPAWGGISAPAVRAHDFQMASVSEAV
jgi:predicted Zn-dependent protease